MSLERSFSGSSRRSHRQSSNPSGQRKCVDGQHYVFSYRVERDRSKFEVNHMISAFEGLVYVDRETNHVLKLTAVTSGFPASWPLTSFSQEVDYGFAEIGGQQLFLPLHAQARATMQDGSQTRNEMEFCHYRKFASDAILKFEP